MPARLSKFIIGDACKDYVHPWTDSCTAASTGLGLHALQECLRLYTTVYIVTLLMKGKIPTRDNIKKTVTGILQSTAFLSWTAFSFPMFICGLRRVLGNFNLMSVAFLPSFLSNVSAIFIERPSRRTLLCLYVSNIATETLFRMAVGRGYFTPISKGEVYIFALSMALLLYFFRSKTNKQDSIYKILRVIVGKYEETDYVKENNLNSEMVTCSANECNRRNEERRHGVNRRLNKGKLNILMRSLDVYKNIIDWLKMRSKHISCPHPYSCAHYTLTGGAKLFSYGLGAQLVLNLVFKLKGILKKPVLIKSLKFKKEDLNLGIFLGGSAAVYRLVSCTLRRFFKKDSSYYAIPAGFIGGLSFMSYRNTTIALYFMWKALQLLWNDLVERKIVPEVNWFVIFCYCFSTAVLFHVALLEPQHLRSSYWKFLYNISGGRIAVMSRIPLDGFGLESSKHLADLLKKTNTTDKRIYSF